MIHETCYFFGCWYIVWKTVWKKNNKPIGIISRYNTLIIFVELQYNIIFTNKNYLVVMFSYHCFEYMKNKNIKL